MRSKAVRVTPLVLVFIAACVGDTVTPGPDGSIPDTSVPDTSTPKDGATDASPADVTTDDSAAPPVDANPCEGGATFCSGQCVDTQTSPNNCGACGLTCTGTCAAGVCTLSTNMPALGTNESVTINALPSALVLISKGTDRLYRVPKDGGNAASLWTGTTYTLYGDIFGVTPTEVIVPTQSGSPIHLVHSNYSQTNTDPIAYGTSGCGRQVVVQGTTVFTVIAFGVSFWTCDAVNTTNCQAMTNLNVSEGTVNTIAINPTQFLWGSDNLHQVRKCTQSNCSGTVASLYTGNFGVIRNLTVTGTDAFWDDGTSKVYTCPIAGCTTPTVVASSEDPVPLGGIATDGKIIYWTDSVAGRVRYCTTPTTGCGTSAQTKVSGQTNARGIAMDGSAIYWIYDTGSATGVRKAPK